MPLLRLVRANQHPEEEGFTAHVQCIARVRVLETSDSGFSTTVEPVYDLEQTDDANDAPGGVYPEERVFRLHETCRDLQAKIDRIDQGVHHRVIPASVPTCPPIHTAALQVMCPPS